MYICFIFVLCYCSCFTNIDGSLTMIVYLMFIHLMFIHLIFCLSFKLCEFKFSFYLLDFYCIFHTCSWLVFNVSRIYRLILSTAAVYSCIRIVLGQYFVFGLVFDLSNSFCTCVLSWIATEGDVRF